MNKCSIKKQFKLTLTIACIVLCYGCSPPQPIEYEYTEFRPDGSIDIYARGINNEGDVVGWFKDANGVRKGFIYSNGEFTELLPDGWEYVQAVGINNKGEVIGNGTTSSGADKFFVYSNGNFTELLPDGPQYAYAWDINDKGEVVGNGGISHGGASFIYSNDEFTELLPDGWHGANAQDINENGAVVGHGEDANGHSKVFIYSNGKYTILPPPCGFNSIDRVIGMSDKGNFVVWAFKYYPPRYNYFLYSNGKYKKMGPQWVRRFAASAMNNNGDVIGGGYDRYADEMKHYLYNDGIYREVMLPASFNITSINDYRIITGNLVTPMGVSKAFIAYPVPQN